MAALALLCLSRAGKVPVAEAIFYLVFVSCIAGVSWVVVGTLAGVRRHRKSRLIKRGLAEYLRDRARPKKEPKPG
jgi:hypothetical protein